MDALETQIIMGICLFGGFLIYGLIVTTIRNRRTKKQRSESSIHCYHCGEPMLESDVFCENCWKITPKVQEMLNKQPNRSQSSYSFISQGYNKRCPHCKRIFDKLGSYPNSNLYLDSPIRYCLHCHQYFIDFINYEWSVCKLSFKLKKLSKPLLLFLFLAQFFCYAPESFGWWQQILIIGKFTFIYLFLFLGWYFIFRRKKHTFSSKRLEINPEYPKILMDMGYEIMMDKKYYHLSKIPIVSLKDTAKELLKDAFTFD